MKTTIPLARPILQKPYNNTIEHHSIIDDKQTKDIVIDGIEKTDEANELSQHEAIKKSYECYYCNEFIPTDNRDAYERHVILTHDGKLAYPLKADLENRLKPQGKN